MKILFVLPFLLLGRLTMIAQDQAASDVEQNIKKENQQLLNQLLFNQVHSGTTANKPTGIKQRVILQTTVEESPIVTNPDSTIYRYSGQRGSEYNFNKDEYTYGRSYPGDYTVLNYGTTVMDVMADSIIRVNYNNAVDFSIANIRPDSKLDSIVNYAGISLVEFQKNYIINFYDAQGNKQKLINLTKYSYNGTIDTFEVVTYIYNSDSKLIADSAFIANGEYYLRRYHYNSQGLIDTMYIRYPSLSQGVTTIQYNNMGFVQKLSWSLDDGYAFEVDSFSYTGNSPIYTLHQNTAGNTGSVSISSKVVKYIGANGLIDSTENFLGYPAWSLDNTYHYYYNTFNNPDSITSKNCVLDHSAKIRFYYETYEYTPPPPPPLSIGDISIAVTFNIYPNPFDDKLYIKCGDQGKHHVQITLLNVLGQTSYAVEMMLIDGINTLDIPKIKKGNYLLLIRDEKRNTVKRTLVKR